MSVKIYQVLPDDGTHSSKHVELVSLLFIYIFNIVHFVALITEYILSFTLLHVHFLQLVLLADYTGFHVINILCHPIMIKDTKNNFKTNNMWQMLLSLQKISSSQVTICNI